MADVPTISSEKLCALTGLTDRRHRQLAKEGYFPPPYRGEYQAWPAITGLFKYHREQLAKKDDTLAAERAKYMKARREKAEIETALLKGDYLKSAEVTQTVENVVSQMKATLQIRLEVEEPPKLAGLDVVDIGSRMEGTVDELVRILREGLQKCSKSPGN